MGIPNTIGAGQQDILHYAGIRVRVNGTGNLRLSFKGLDNSIEQTLVPLVMAQTPGRIPTRLANFISQRGSLVIKTTAINEVFKISQIVLFTKPLWSEYPA